jgi:hypothetical protein
MAGLDAQLALPRLSDVAGAAPIPVVGQIKAKVLPASRACYVCCEIRMRALKPLI